MNILTVDNITKSYGVRKIFDGASFFLQEGEKEMCIRDRYWKAWHLHCVIHWRWQNLWESIWSGPRSAEMCIRDRSYYGLLIKR